MTTLVLLDTNVLVSALITKNLDSPTVKIVRTVLEGVVTPLYHEKILAEYADVLIREKFHLDPRLVQVILSAIAKYGIHTEPVSSNWIFPDEDDRIFYEVVLGRQKEGARLVTGNTRHFPDREFVVTPAEMVKTLGL